MNTFERLSTEEQNKRIQAKDLLSKAFKLLRKKGYIARQSFSCCNNCAGYEIATELTKKIEKDPSVRDKISGVVNYSVQSKNDLVERGLLYLQFGNIETVKFGDIGKDSKEVGKDILQALADVGLQFHWEGDITQCIAVGPESHKLYEEA